MRRDVNTKWKTCHSWYFSLPGTLALEFQLVEQPESESYDGVTQVTYRIHLPPPDSQPENFARLIPISTRKLHKSDKIDNSTIVMDHSWRICDSRSITCFSNGGINLLMSESQLPVLADGGAASSYPPVKILDQLHDLEDTVMSGRFSFDPASGRLCCLASDGTFLVLDY